MKCESGCIILAYHSISQGRPPLRIPPALFEAQLSWLKANACVLPLEEVVDALANGALIPSHAVALTFDDGFLNFYSTAAPRLRAARLPATVFLATDYCGRTNRWPGQPNWVEEEPLMGWQHITELAQQGIGFGAHSASHPHMTQLSGDELVPEIVASKREIERRLSKPVHTFCYPYGDWDARVRSLLTPHYRGACSTRTAIATLGDDPYSLPRVDAHLVRSPAIFKAMFSSAFPWYLSARRAVRRLRGQPESVYS